jgi:ATP-binding cassette subfamily B protein
VGVVGLSGSGKSTFAKLLLKLYAPSKGGVFFDNLNVAEIRRENYLQHVAYVPQESELFHLSLAQNIAMSAKPNVELLRQVIQDSGLESLVMRLPDGLETLLGERGQRLSGGERQRVALARALYRQAPILILDEATSHLDEQTELHVQKALERSAHTMIVIAHRYSTLKNMDCIFHFHEDGFVRYNNLESFLRANSNFHAS